MPTNPTALPWKIEPGKLPDSGREMFRVRADDGSAEPVVAICFPTSDGEIYEDTAKANAEFIHRATAAHAVMLDALKDAIESLRRLPNTDGAFRNTVLRQCEKAVAVAEGRRVQS